MYNKAEKSAKMKNQNGKWVTEGMSQRRSQEPSL